MRFTRKPHPNSAEHEVIVFDTKVHHELAVEKGLSDADVEKEIMRYLRGYDYTDVDSSKKHIKGYEDHYPETRLGTEEGI